MKKTKRERVGFIDLLFPRQGIWLEEGKEFFRVFSATSEGKAFIALIISIVVLLGHTAYWLLSRLVLWVS